MLAKVKAIGEVLQAIDTNRKKVLNNEVISVGDRMYIDGVMMYTIYRAIGIGLIGYDDENSYILNIDFSKNKLVIKRKIENSECKDIENPLEKSMYTMEMAYMRGEVELEYNVKNGLSVEFRNDNTIILEQYLDVRGRAQKIFQRLN